MNRTTLSLTLAIVSLAGVFAQEPNYANLLVKVDKATDLSDVDCSAVLQLKKTDPENGNSDETFAIFLRDAKSTFSILQLAPESKKGTGYLKTGDDMYTYDPSSRKFNYTSMKPGIPGRRIKSVSEISRLRPARRGYRVR